MAELLDREPPLASLLVFWFWCRWRGHGRFAFETIALIKPGRPALEVRVCSGCGRIWPEDIDPACDVLEGDLAEMEAQGG